jgi:hypothetical protein
MEEPITRLLGYTKKKFEDALREPDGAGRIKRQLEQINVDQMIDQQKMLISSGKKTKRDSAVRLLKYSRRCQEDWDSSRSVDDVQGAGDPTSLPSSDGVRGHADDLGC